MEVLASGQGEYRPPDPDGFREWVRTHKSRSLVDKTMSEQEAVARFVADGDYLSYDCNYYERGPCSLVREVIRQGRRDLWVAGKFSYALVAVLAAGGCVSKIDVGFVGLGRSLARAVEEGRIKLVEYSNVALVVRHQAGAAGVPFLPLRLFGGTDSFLHSGAKLVRDPFTGQPVTLLPAINPDVALIHVHQCDVYGNARIFGTMVAPVETALASRKVIISTEEIIDSEEIRRQPGLTTIPYYAVDAVVLAPFGAYPGTVAGRYASDSDHVLELQGALEAEETMQAYIEKYVHSVASHEEMLQERVGVARLLELQRREVIREGYYP